MALVQDETKQLQKKNCYNYLLHTIIFILITLLVFVCSYKSKTVNFNGQHRSLFLSNVTCPIQGDKWIVVTTIFYPTPAIHKFLSLTSHWNLIVVADKKNTQRLATTSQTFRYFFSIIFS